MQKNQAAMELGSLGGKKYAKNHTKSQRSANARRAAKARWEAERAKKAALEEKTSEKSEKIPVRKSNKTK